MIGRMITRPCIKVLLLTMFRMNGMQCLHGYNRDNSTFCSRTHVQESVVYNEHIETGQRSASTQMLLLLRVGETACVTMVFMQDQSTNNRPTNHDARRYSRTRVQRNIKKPANAYRGSSIAYENFTDNNISISSPAVPSMYNGSEMDGKSTSGPHLYPPRDQKRSFKVLHDDISDLLESFESKNSSERSSGGIDKDHSVMTTLENNFNSKFLQTFTNISGAVQNISHNPKTDLMYIDENTTFQSHMSDTDINTEDSKLTNNYETLAQKQSHPRFISGKKSRATSRDSDMLDMRISTTLLAFNYRILDTYDFLEPELNISCTCACASFHTCDPCGSLCVSLTSAENTVDCTTSLLGSARTCCQVLIGGRRRFTAVQLANGVASVRLEISCKGAPRQLVEAQIGEEFHLDMNHTHIKGVVLSVQEKAMPPAWYILHGDKLYNAPNVNRKNEYNLRKLGWLKVGKKIMIPNQRRLHSAFDVFTQSCTEQKFQVKNDAMLDDVISQLGAPVAGDNYLKQYRTHLVIEPTAQYPMIWLSVHLDRVRKLRYLIHRAYLSDFHGKLRVDSQLQTTVELRLVNATGIQHVTLEVVHKDQIIPSLFHFSWPARPAWIVPLNIALGNQQNQVKLCIRSDGDLNKPVCRLLPVLRDALEPITSDQHFNDNVLIISRSNPTNNLERFIRALNPADWLRSSSSWSSAAGVAVDFVLVILLVTVVWKIFVCFNACCKWRKK